MIGRVGLTLNASNRLRAAHRHGYKRRQPPTGEGGSLLPSAHSTPPPLKPPAARQRKEEELRLGPVYLFLS